MIYYSIPFHPSHLMKGEEHPGVDLKVSIEQFLDLMFTTKWPEEGSAIKNFGCSIRKYTFASQGRKVESAFLRELELDIKKSIERSIRECEQRLILGKVLVTIINTETEDKEEKKLISSQRPIYYWLSVNINGKILVKGKNRVFKYEKKMPLG